VNLSDIPANLHYVLSNLHDVTVNLSDVPMNLRDIPAHLSYVQPNLRYVLLNHSNLLTERWLFPRRVVPENIASKSSNCIHHSIVPCVSIYVSTVLYTLIH
jgi:hypothetical protein